MKHTLKKKNALPDSAGCKTTGFMKGIRKYKTFLEARLDMYRERYKKEFDWQEAKKFHSEFEKFCKENNLSVMRPIYPRGIYFFKTIKEARKDMMERLIRRACERS